MRNLKNECKFEGRIYDPKFSTVQMNGNDIDKVFFKLIVPKQLSKEQRDKAKNDNSIETSTFVPMSAIGAPAKFIKDWFPAGKAALISASYETYKKTNSQSGEKEYGHIFNVDSIEFVSSDSKNVESNNNSSSNSNSSSNNNSSGFSMFEDTPDDQKPW